MMRVQDSTVASVAATAVLGLFLRRSELILLVQCIYAAFIVHYRALCCITNRVFYSYGKFIMIVSLI